MIDIPIASGAHMASTAMKRVRSIPVRTLFLPMLVGLLGLYIAVHSPLRGVIASLFKLDSRGCFFCLESFSWSQALAGGSAWIFLAVALAAAWLHTRQVRFARYERALMVGLSGLAWLVIPAAMLGQIGDWAAVPLLRPPLGPLLSALPAAGFVAAQVRQGWRPRWPIIRVLRPSPLLAVVGGLTVLALLSSLAISLAHPPTRYDALSYHAPLGVFLWRDGGLAAFLDRAPSDWALANPGTAELWSGLLQVAGGEPLADQCQLPFALLGGAAVYVFARRLGMRSAGSALSAGAFLLMPIVIVQVGTQLNDVTGAALLMSTLALASAPRRDWGRDRMALIGLGLGLVMTTKLVLLPSVAAIAVFLMLGLYRDALEQKNWRPMVVHLGVAGLIALAVVAPWALRNVTRYGNPVYPAALPLIGRGYFDASKADSAFVPDPIAWPLYPFLEAHDEQSGFGALFLVSLIPGALCALRMGRRQPLFLYGVVTAIALATWWLLTQHFPRFLLASAGLAYAFLPWSLLAIPRRQRWMGALLVACGALLSTMITFQQALIPFAAQTNTRAEFYDQVWAVDPIVQSLPETEGILYHTGFAPIISQYAGYYPLLGRGLSRVVVPVDLETTTTDAIAARMSAAQVRYAYVVASPAFQAEVQALYPSSRFELVHRSAIILGDRIDTRRFAYLQVEAVAEPTATQRFLFRLK